MSSKRQSHKRTAAERALADDVRAAAGELGWLMPRDPDAVRRAEAELGPGPMHLPESLADAADVFDSPSGLDCGASTPFPRDADVDATLARAAREGGAIAPEIEQRMRRDRAAAERQADDEDQAT